MLANDETKGKPQGTSQTARFRDALMFAAQLHANQKRKGGSVPYISHLMAVCSTVLDNGGDEDEAIAALLHDSIEDQARGDAEGMRLRIGRLFGERVLDIVNACTDSDTDPKPPWFKRKEDYLARLPQESPSARLVSLADKLHNARSILADYEQIGDRIWERFKGGKEGTMWYYSSLKEIFQEQGASPLVNEFVRVVSELERLVGAGSPKP